MAMSCVYSLILILHFVKAQPTTCPAYKDNENTLAELKEELGKLKEGIHELQESNRIQFDKLHTIIEVLLEETRNSSKHDALPTCGAWRTSGALRSGWYILDPDGNGHGVKPFTAYCDMVAKNGIGVTIFHHNNESRNYINEIDRCDPVRCYKQEITYGQSLSNIISLIDISSKCEQFIKYECYDSVILHYANRYAAWYDRKGHLTNYWGGGEPGGKTCACGVSGTCANGRLDCNCDNNDAVWRYDEGTITQKDDLPVTAVTFGDLGNPGEEGYWTLGGLKCYE